MPVNVRPSWVDVQIDGNKKDLSSGPRSKTGNMKATFKVRDRGSVAESVTVETFVREGKGGLYQTLTVKDPAGKVVFEHDTLL